MKRAVIFIMLLTAFVLMRPISAMAQQPVSEELPLFAPNAKPVDRLTDWRVRGFVMLTVARINLHDPTVIDVFGLNGLYIFGGFGIPEEARFFLTHHALPMKLYPDTILVMRSEGDLVAQLTFGGFLYKGAISTYLWWLQPKGLGYIVESSNYMELAAPTNARVSPVIEIGINAGGITTSERMFSGVQIFQFNVTNYVPADNAPGNPVPFVSIYKANYPNANMMEAQRRISQGISPNGMDVPGLTYEFSLQVAPQSEGFWASELEEGVYFIQKMTQVGDRLVVDEGPFNVNMFVVK